MWLLSTSRAKLRYFNSPDDVLYAEGGYAILSHVWEEKEQSFQEIQALILHATTSTGDTPRSLASPKIRNCCMLAEKHGYKWVWIDTCCIDKTSSSELSEAINSMYQWYAKAAVCYAYLDDVFSPDLSPHSRFYNSQWFRRGWTLQELIAPISLLFVSRNWTIVGSRTELVTHLERITRIDAKVLLQRRELGKVSIAERMSWAAGRVTTRPEDEAYCLMGIFGVNMPTLYGEGRAAFYRLQEEIMKVSPDQTLFVWGHQHKLREVLEWGVVPGLKIPSPSETGPFDLRNCCLLASSPHEFKLISEQRPVPIPVKDAMKSAKETCVRLSKLSGLLRAKAMSSIHRGAASPDEWDTSEFIATSQGMRSTLPVISLEFPNGDLRFDIAILGCQDARTGAVIGLLLRPIPPSLNYGGDRNIYASYSAFDPEVRQLVVFTTDSERHLPGEVGVGASQRGCATWDISWSTIYVLHRPLPHMQPNFGAVPSRKTDPDHTGFLFSAWSISELRERGFRPTEDPAYMFRLRRLHNIVTFVSDDPNEGFTVTIGRCPNQAVTGRVQDKWPMAANVSFSRPLEGSPTPIGSLSKQPAETLALDKCPDHHFEKKQNWKKKFGDEYRAVELTFNSGYFQHSVILNERLEDDFHKREDIFYVVDIRVSGKVYRDLAHRANSTSEVVPGSQQAVLDTDNDTATVHNIIEAPFNYASSNSKGSRRFMEDAHSVVAPFAGIHGQGFFAVFDGYSGKHAAEWSAQNFSPYLLESLRKFPSEIVPSVLNLTFHTVDNTLMKIFEESDGRMHSGCTAVTAFLRLEDNKQKQSFLPPDFDPLQSLPESGANAQIFMPAGVTPLHRVLYCANVGDARCVLCRSGRAVRLTYDHRASDKHEAKRVMDAGGFVMSGRVIDEFPISRSLGYSPFKHLVVGAPYTTETELAEVDEFLILACAGLWDAVDDQGAVDLVRGMRDSKKAADELLDYAYRNYATDNVTVIVVRFRDPPEGVESVN